MKGCRNTLILSACIASFIALSISMCSCIGKRKCEAIGFTIESGIAIADTIKPKDNPLFRKGEKYRYDTSLKALKGIKDDSKD